MNILPISKCGITKTMAVYYSLGTAIPPQIGSLVVPPLEFQISTLCLFSVFPIVESRKPYLITIAHGLRNRL